MNLPKKAIAGAVVWMVLFGSSAWSSALFEGKAANLWLVDANTGEVTSYGLGDWLEDYQLVDGEITLPSGFQGLVNQLPNSSVPMSAAQPGISVIGLTPADFQLGDHEGPALLRVSPAAGPYTETIDVSLRVEPSQLEGETLNLRWRINEGAWQNRSLSSEDQPATGQGYIEQSLYLIRDGEHRLDVELRKGTTVLASDYKAYSLASIHEDGELRDSDEDGLPDLVEQAIGLNPLTRDLDEPSHLEGWTRFDLWLRCDQEVLDTCSEPTDTDGDGWSDLDEQWRGTRHDDPDEFSFTEPPEPDSDAERQLIRHYQEFPSARRPYEVEYLLNADPMALTPDRLTAATIYGATGWQLDDLVTQADLDEAQLTGAELAPGRLMANAEQAMNNGEWPAIRLPASDAALIRADQSVPAGEGTARAESLLYLAPKQDLIPTAFNVADYGTWSKADEWKAHYRTWLSTELIQSVSPSFVQDESRVLLTLEFLLAEEARLREISTAFRLGVPDQPLAWLADFKAALEHRSSGVTLSDLIGNLRSVLEPTALLGDDAVQMDAWLAALPEDTSSRQWLSEKLTFSQTGEDLGCFIPQQDWDGLNEPGNEDLLQQFQAECPEHYTSTDLNTWQQESLDRRYRLRLMLLADGPGQLDSDATLASANADSDDDTSTNGNEILLRPYRWHTLPWLSDTDTDGYADGSDICPLDRFNRCTGEPEQNQLFLGNTLTVSKPLYEGTVLLSMTLDRPAEREVIVNYQVWSSSEDSAVDGEDFLADSGQLVIQPGQTTLLVPVTLLGGGEGDQFRLDVVDVEGAEINGPDFTLVELTDYAAGSPVAKVMASNLILEETQSLVLDATLSYDPNGSPLTFAWQDSPTLGQSLVPGNAGFAELTAPNLAADDTVFVTVTVANEALNTDQASMEVLISAEDDAPTITSVPAYQVDRNAGRVIALSELQNSVEDPEGGPVYIDLVSSQPEGLLAELTDTQLLLEGDGVTTETIGELGAQYNSIVEWQGEGFAFLTSTTDTVPARLYGWHPKGGLQLLYPGESGQYLSSLIYDSKNDRFYFDRVPDGGERLLSWMDADGTLDGVSYSNVYGGTYRRQLNTRAQALYLCNIDPEEWVYLDTLGKTVVETNEPCSGNRQTIQTTRQVCLESDGFLRCTTPDSTDPTLDTSVSLNGQALLALRSMDDRLIVMLENPKTLRTLLAQAMPGSALATLKEWNGTDLTYGLSIRENTLTVSLANDVLEIYRWQPEQEAPLGFSSEIPINTGEGFYTMSVTDTGKTVFGSAAISATDTVLYRFDPTTGTFATLNTLGENDTDVTAYGYELTQSPRGLALSVQYGDGQCNWHLLGTSGTVSPVYLESTACNDAIVSPDLEVHRGGLSRYVLVSGGTFTGQTTMDLQVSDEGGNSTILPVELNVVEDL